MGGRGAAGDAAHCRAVLPPPTVSTPSPVPAATRVALPGRLWAWLRADPLRAVLVLALPPLAAASGLPWRTYGALVDLPTLAALTGLLLLTKAVELSGGLQHLGQWLLQAMATERRAALALVLAAALLSTVLTNDVALFVVVPLTLGMGRLAPVPVVRLVVFEALAVNTGSALTPIGNPQNLFLWQLSHDSFAAFTLQMLPLVAGLMVLLLAWTALAFSGRPLVLHSTAPAPAVDRPLLWAALALYLPFLVLTDQHQALWAMAAVAVLIGGLRPAVLRQLDWGLLLVFVLMFIDLRLLAGLAPVRGLMAGQDLLHGPTLFWMGVAGAQLISNVPAAIVLAEYTQNWRVVAWAVNVGGYGLMLGSLANLIALRLLGDPRGWRVFHAHALPFLALACGWAWLVLFVWG